MKQPQASVHPLIRDILLGRGLDESDFDAFLNPSYDEHLHDPFLLTDMTQAVSRIERAAAKHETVVVYGDYDIDGITASAIMIEGLAHLGIVATSYIPDRFEEGYGLNEDAMTLLKDRGTDLVITVDCGITSLKEAALAKRLGLDLIITDHHTPLAETPEAIAVINPKRAGDSYPFKDLCGAGVAFKVVQALQQRTGTPKAGQEKWLLDLVALGTVCDVVTLVGENRVLVSFGLKVMRQTRRAGLRALAGVGGTDIARITSHHLGFVLGPRMNAAGRLEHAARSLELMVTPRAERAAEISLELDELNTQRRSTQAAVFAQADVMAEAYAADPVLVLADASWNHGIVGIVASKLVEKWHKPVLVAQVLGEHTKGSARSMGSFNMVEALRANGDIFTKFGGHFYAAGYTLPTDRLDALRQGLNDYYRSSGADTTTVPPTPVDARLDSLEGADLELLQVLSQLEPYGAANPQPMLQLNGLTAVEVKKIGKEATHLRLGLRDASGVRIAGVGFGMASKHPALVPGTSVRILGHLEENEWQGRRSMQLMVKEIHYE